MKKTILTLLPKTFSIRLLHYYFRMADKSFFKQAQNKRLIETDSGYSYKPFDDNKTIFIHVPKCAGVSINKVLFGNLAGGHTQLSQYLKIFEPEVIRDYFKFTIVRNPWDRVVSAYHFLKNGGFDEKDEVFYENELSKFEDFDDFVINWLTRENIFKWHHFCPQYHYIIDKWNLIELDFIGFFENLDEDFIYISNKLKTQKSIYTSNKSKHLHYTDYYTEHTKNIVSNVYSEDIKLLGYNFDNSSLPKQIQNRNNGKKISLNHDYI